ncbi:oxaloacetate decarboxylase [Desulfuribacillus stibiiarsenatis]|uniref:Oxaloacetate decarboxylase n=1 Tax=Desulfuribacillus stibiiarsenatis TaxID=1390249 RepID=A0A1E5L7T0_9FIRM|nr:oxaloacetate decarboxylase subunit alpha [Desulfuribacillus stibiiarsenatis]OEH86108.1 oxaloacetate decarboxylase [Desulfuribacillus stibiiarsenatis]
MDKNRRVGVTDTTLRDAHQSLLATRMKIEHMLPIAEQIEEIGFHSAEVWGGATFDTCMRFLDEDPWARLRALKKVFKKTPLQMLLRGQNLVGYKHYADDVVDEFVKRAIGNGINILRIFDALNDTRNMERACKATIAEGGHAQLALSYTISDLHDLNYYLKKAEEFKQIGAHSICIKDMAGILSPYGAYELVSELKEKIGLPVQLHSHYTSGMASMMYLKAVEAGLDVFDTAISTMALGSSQPATETMVASLQGTPYDTGLALDKLSLIAEYFKKARKDYKEFDISDSTVDVNVLLYQIPGGMISNFITQLSQQNALDRLPEVFVEVPKVREDFGYPPLVTPSSQIVGTQAVLNVLSGERYKSVTNEVKAYMKGQYGAPPGKVNEEVRKKIIGDETPITVRPADLLEPQLESSKAEIAHVMQKPEDLLSYIMFPQFAKGFLEKQLEKKAKLDLSCISIGESNKVQYPL